MTFLPIAERELRVAARSPRTYWSRALAALVTIGIALLIFDSYAKFGRAKVGGQQVFSALAGLALAYSLFAGAALTSDCISSEKRDETLGFLFLRTNPYWLPALWLGLGLATDLAWTLWARRRVLGGFRQAASMRLWRD